MYPSNRYVSALYLISVALIPFSTLPLAIITSMARYHTPFHFKPLSVWALASSILCFILLGFPLVALLVVLLVS